MNGDRRTAIQTALDLSFGKLVVRDHPIPFKIAAHTDFKHCCNKSSLFSQVHAH